MKKHLLRKFTSCVLAAAILLGSAASGLVGSGAVAYGATVPKDVQDHWAKSFVTKAIDNKIVSGYSDGTFRPDKAVSRAEFSHMLNAALGNNATASITFKDVKSSDWYYADVRKAVSAGYVAGYDDGTFKPTASITRQEAAVMLTRVIPTYNTSTSLTKFKDASSVASWATDFVKRAVGAGYISGTGTGTNIKLDPLGKLTRAQAVVIVCKILENETIVKSTQAVTSDTTLSNKIYSNGISIPSNMTGDVTISNCVVLGTLNMAGGDNVTVTNSRVASAVAKSTSGDLIAKGETSIKTVTVSGDTSLTTDGLKNGNSFSTGFETVTIGQDVISTLTGTFPLVNVTGADTQITIPNGTTVTKMVITGANAALKGTGTVSLMNANANGITYEKRPSTVSTNKNVTTAPKLVDAELTVTTDPVNGATNFPVDDTIILTFNSAVKLYDGSTLDDSDVDDILQLRISSASGSLVGFSAEVNSAKTKITLTPDEELQGETKYYITMAQNKVKNSDGTGNKLVSNGFTTEKVALDNAVFSPKKGAVDVSVEVIPTITFSEKVICYDESAVTSTDLQDIIIFRETNSTGDDVPFEASINSAKTKITITPDYALDENKTYYLAIDSRSLRLDSNNDVVDAQSVTWTTKDSSPSATFSPANKATGVSKTVDPTITFDRAVIRYSGSSAVDSAYLKEVIELREGSSTGTKISFNASINSAKTKVTIDPGTLKEGVTYYLSYDNRSFRAAADESKFPASEVYWTVTGTASKVTVANTSATENTIAADVYGSVKGTIYGVLLPSGSKAPTADQIKNGQNGDGVVVPSTRKANTGTLNANTEKRLNFTSLDTKTNYVLYLVLYPSSGSTSAVINKSVATTAPAIPAAVLSGITLSSGTLTFKADTTTYTVELPNGTDVVTVTANAKDNANIAFDGSGTSQQAAATKDVNVSSGKGTISIAVFDAEKTETVYTINFVVKSNTELETLTANGSDIKSSLSYTLTADDGTSITLYIETADPDAEITGGMTDLHIREATLTVDYGKETEYSFTVVSTNGVEKDYVITLKNPNTNPEAVTSPGAIE